MLEIQRCIKYSPRPQVSSLDPKFFRKWDQKMKSTFGFNVRKEKAMDAEIAVTLHLLTDAARIIYTGFGGDGKYF